jgi:membrane protein DedA with SNARE-associated domain
MPTTLPAAFVLLLVHPLWRWLHRLGGPGLIVLGIADSSIVPLPGSMDLFVIILSAHHRTWWLYYALMAVLGSVVGGYLTYRLAERGGEETLEKKIGKARAEKVYRRFEKHGFSTVFVGAILPPPFPIVPVLMAPGVLKYPRHKFIAALAAGRALRFTVVAFLGQHYGTGILGWLRHYYRPLLHLFVSLAIAGGIAVLVYFKWYRPRQADKSNFPGNGKTAARSR